MHKSGTRTSNCVDTLLELGVGMCRFLRGRKEQVHVACDSAVGGELGQPTKMSISEHVCVSLPFPVMPPASGCLSCSKAAPHVARKSPSINTGLHFPLIYTQVREEASEAQRNHVARPSWHQEVITVGAWLS